LGLFGRRIGFIPRETRYLPPVEETEAMRMTQNMIDLKCLALGPVSSIFMLGIPDPFGELDRPWHGIG